MAAFGHSGSQTSQLMQSSVMIRDMETPARAVSQGIWKESHYLATNIFNAHVSYTHKEGFDRASLSNHLKVTDRTWNTLLHRSWGISGILPPYRILSSPLRRNISESLDWEFSSLKMEGNFSMKRIFLQVHSLLEFWSSEWSETLVRESSYTWV